MRIKLTIDRIEGETAVLKTEDNKSINWPLKQLPAEMREGSVLNFTVQSDQEAEKESKNIAKDILNEILGDDEAE